MELKEQFEQAAQDVQRLKSAPGNDDKLKLYALFKQASQGNVSGKKPGMFDLVGKAKYDAWEKLQGMSDEEAMKAYIAKVTELLNAE